MKVYGSITITNVEDGAPGRSITNETKLYYASLSDKTAPPTPDDAPELSTHWLEVIHNGWSSDTYIWTTTRREWSDDTIDYMPKPPTLMSQVEAATLSAQKSGLSLGEWCSRYNVTIIDGSVITTGSINADKLNVNDISAISANLGTIETGEICSRKYGGITVWEKKADPPLVDSVGLAFQTKSDGVSCAITGIGSCTDTDIVIPSTLNGLTVSEIGTSAFLGCTSLTSIVIPDSVTSIGYRAFRNCTNLTSVVIGDGVTGIGSEVFYGCSSLTSVVIPDSVTSIGGYTFYNCSSLTSVEIPNSVTSIGQSAFGGCSSLESITLPFVGGNRKTASNTYQYPFGYIFSTNSYTGGTATKQYYYGSSTSSTTYSTYYIPTSLKKVTITGGNILYGAFYDCDSLTSVVIPEGITSIGVNAFYGCGRLNNIVIPDSVISIGNNAFSGCSSLVSAVFGKNVTSVGSRSFDNCHRLVEIYNKSDFQLSTFNSFLKIGCNVLNVYKPNTGYSKLEIDDFGCIIYNNSSTSRYFVGYIGEETDLHIPDNVTNIRQYALYQCDTLTSVIIPISVTSIGQSAFDSCLSLSKVYYGGTKINWDAMTISDDNLSLTNAKLYYYSKDEPTTYGNYWRSNDENGFKISCDGDNMIESKYFNVTHDGKITATAGTIGGWTMDDGKFVFNKLSDISNNMGVVEAGTIQTPNYDKNKVVIWGNDELESDISEESGYCTGLLYTSVNNGSNWEVSGISDNCTDTDIIIPSKYDGKAVVRIGREAFYENQSITSVLIPDSVTYIDQYAFGNCSNLQHIIIGDGVIDIDGGAFSNCTSLLSVIIPKSTKTIGHYAFDKCSSLNHVYYKGIEGFWELIEVGLYNEPLIDHADIYFYSATKPAKDGNYWHYSGFKISCSDDNMIESESFKVTHDGKIMATSGNIGSCSILDGEIVSSNGNFRVDADGDLRASNVNLTGTITATKGQIGPLTIQEDGTITSGGDKITLFSNGTIVANKIQATNIDMDNFIVDTISSSLGTSIDVGYQKTDYEKLTPRISSATISAAYELNWSGSKIKNNGQVDIIIYWGTPLKKDNVLTIQLPYYNLFAGKSAYQNITLNITADSAYLKFNVYGAIDVGGDICVLQVDQSKLNQIDGIRVLNPTTIKQIARTEGSAVIRCKGNLVGVEKSNGVTSNSLGTSDLKWDSIYAQEGRFTTVFTEDGTVKKSDQNKKNTINPISSDYGQVFDKLRPVTFKYNDGTSDRTHTGFIAQEVRDAALESGLTTKDFAAYCEWTEEDGTSTCGLRYSEFIAMCVDQIQKLKTRVEELENALSTRQND